MDWYLVALLALAVLSGATASIAGFGIGSILTPFLASRLGTPMAIAAVSLPHAAATVLRCFRLRAAIRWNILLRFGLVSAAGSLAGVALYSRLSNTGLTLILGALLVATALVNLTGWVERWHPDGAVVPLFGFASGLFGGVAGNQGGLRAAALTAFGLAPAAYVATSTATGVMVDAVRAPVYLYRTGAALRPMAGLIALATVGVLIGTLWGERILFGLSPARFRRLVACAVGLLGVWLLWSAS